jgi:hypothetical protein
MHNKVNMNNQSRLSISVMWVKSVRARATDARRSEQNACRTSLLLYLLLTIPHEDKSANFVC